MMKEPRRLNITGLLETALYLDDVGAAARFYTDLFGFPLLIGDVQGDPIFAALEVPGESVLLLFKKGANAKPVETGGGLIPPHGGEGRLHLAFAIGLEEYEPWKAKLAARNIGIESEVRWQRGGRSIYFRDPEGNLVELATSGLWAFGPNSPVPNSP
jgi:catechol 2,3-dioxygenase-like lactoylglutathione lyase family enzyme